MPTPAQCQASLTPGPLAAKMGGSGHARCGSRPSGRTGGALRRAALKPRFCAPLAALWLAAHGAAAASERATVERLGMAPVPSTYRYTCLNDLAKRLDAAVTTDELTGVVTVRSGDRSVAVAPGIAGAAVGSRFVPLGEEVVTRYGRLYVPRRLASELEAYLAPPRPPQPRPEPHPPKERPEPPSAPRPTGRVCIDPGHGGKDPGAMSRWGLAEKEVVLATALLLAAELRERKFDVVLTRERDVFIELEDRPAVASRRGADLFVSIHANAMRDASYRGLEIFYWYGSWGAASPAVRREGVELAQAIRRACERAGLRVRSMRGADYKVLRYSKVPATLVEIGFLTNRAEEQALRTTAYRQRVARAIADGIAAYRSGSR